MTDRFLNGIIEYAEKLSLFPKSGTVLAAVSGGCDSMCLLHTLVMLSDKFGFSVEAVHFNHLLRGEESDRDENFVSEHCRSLGITCHIGRGDVNAEAACKHLSIEEAARNMRYAFFDKVYSETGAKCIATAHSADDNVETILINLARGAGATGLCGIPPVRDNIIRPMLCVSRSEIELFLKENSIPHVEDSSNAEDDYTRNKIRHHVVPVLKGINSSLARSVAQTAELLYMDNMYLNDLADEFIRQNVYGNKLSASKLSQLPYPIYGRVVRKLIPGLSKKHIDIILDLCKNRNPSSEISLPKITVRREYDKLVIGKSKFDTFSPFIISPGQTVVIEESGLKIICEKCIFDRNIHNSFNNFVLKCDSIHGIVLVRPRTDGDKISLINRNGTKSLKKLYIDAHIPSAERGLIPVIADDLGVMAVYKFGTDKRNKASFGDTVLNIKIEEII